MTVVSPTANDAVLEEELRCSFGVAGGAHAVLDTLLLPRAERGQRATQVRLTVAAELSFSLRSP